MAIFIAFLAASPFIALCYALGGSRFKAILVLSPLIIILETMLYGAAIGIAGMFDGSFFHSMAGLTTGAEIAAFFIWVVANFLIIGGVIAQNNNGPTFPSPRPSAPQAPKPPTRVSAAVGAIIFLLLDILVILMMKYA